MELVCLFGFRPESYPGESYPELLEAIDDIGDSDNPDFLNEKEEEYQNTGDFIILKRIRVSVDEEHFKKVFFGETLQGKIEEEEG